MSRPGSSIDRASRKGRLPLFSLLACAIVFVLQKRMLRSPFNSSVAVSNRNVAMATICTSPANESFRMAYDQSYGYFDDISDANWKMAQERARTRVNHFFTDPMNHLGTPPQARMWFLHNYEPDFACSHDLRVGGLGDGPKWVCDPHRLKLKKDCLIYTVGNPGELVFEKGVHDIVGDACDIHVFDTSPIESAIKMDDINAHFHQWGFKGSYDNTSQFSPESEIRYMTLQETMKELGHEGRTIDIFKVDCEGCETTSIKDWLEVDTRQILVEMHGVDNDTDDVFQALQIAHFYLFHRETNLFTRGESIEWSFIRLHPTFWNETETE